MHHAPRKTRNEKIRIVKLVTEEGCSIAEACRREGINISTLRRWLGDRRFNPDEEYARLQEEKGLRRNSARKPRDPFPEGILMAARNNPEELARENVDLRKKVAYLEDKVAYLETLYSILKEEPGEVSKKNGSRPSAGSHSGDGQT